MYGKVQKYTHEIFILLCIYALTPRLTAQVLSDGMSINLHRISISHACYSFTRKTLHIDSNESFAFRLTAVSVNILWISIKALQMRVMSG
jgi:EamA domain-containing membrane protein RarD